MGKRVLVIVAVVMVLGAAAGAASPTATETRYSVVISNEAPGHLVDRLIAAGSVSKTTDVPAGAYAQINDVGAWLGVPAGWTTIAVKGSGRWSGTVSTIDPYTGDPTTVIGIPR